MITQEVWLGLPVFVYDRETKLGISQITINSEPKWETDESEEGRRRRKGRLRVATATTTTNERGSGGGTSASGKAGDDGGGVVAVGGGGAAAGGGEGGGGGGERGRGSPRAAKERTLFVSRHAETDLSLLFLVDPR
ncbi:hypothetical protein M0804_004920 [Polistes exclamans]|nr:hypothetical protein M0804_004920 [Polistes exclamans]